MTKYNVVCRECGAVFTPEEGTPAWWIAKKRPEKFLDATRVDSKYCGCIEPFVPTSPFVISGYDMMCTNFKYGVPTFVAAIKALRRHKMDTVFATGISNAVLSKLGLW